MNTDTTLAPKPAERADAVEVGVDMAAPAGLIIIASATLTVALLSAFGAVALAAAGRL